MNIAIGQKQILRKLFQEKRRNLLPAQRINLSQNIAENFRNFFISNNSYQINNKIVASYIATRFEADPIYIEAILKQHNCSICYPQIQEQDRVLKFIQYDDKNNFIANKNFANILEPSDGKALIPDFILVPLVAFDAKLNRIGMGKGYYDATLHHYKQLNPALKSCGIAFDSQQVNKVIPIENNDSPLDFVATNFSIIAQN